MTLESLLLLPALLLFTFRWCFPRFCVHAAVGVVFVVNILSSSQCFHRVWLASLLLVSPDVPVVSCAAIGPSVAVVLSAVNFPWRSCCG
jgi:hypothetical protein